jgi:hypothetical protein
MLKKIIILLFFPILSFAQPSDGGLEGTIISSINSLSIDGATIELLHYPSLFSFRTQLADKAGFFSFDSIPEGYFQLRISYMGFNTLRIDSVHIYEERKFVNLGDLILSASSTELETIVIYAEKPLIQTKEMMGKTLSEIYKEYAAEKRELVKKQPPIIRPDQKKRKYNNR